MLCLLVLKPTEFLDTGIYVNAASGGKKIPPCLYFLEKKVSTAEIQPPFHSAFQILHKCI